jgi:hypothetical protein
MSTMNSNNRIAATRCFLGTCLGNVSVDTLHKGDTDDDDDENDDGDDNNNNNNRMHLTTSLLFLVLVAVVFLNLMAGAHVSSARPDHRFFPPSHTAAPYSVPACVAHRASLEPLSLADQLLEIPNKSQLFCQHFRKTVE